MDDVCNPAKHKAVIVYSMNFMFQSIQYFYYFYISLIYQDIFDIRGLGDYWTRRLAIFAGACLLGWAGGPYYEAVRDASEYIEYRAANPPPFQPQVPKGCFANVVCDMWCVVMSLGDAWPRRVTIISDCAIQLYNPDPNARMPDCNGLHVF